MKTPLTKLLCSIAVFGIAASAYSLTIVPTFDSSITSDPNAAAMTNAINAAIRVLQSNITDNVTVKITFVSDEGVGLGQSSTFGDDYSYSSFLAALKSHARSVNDTNALKKLPNSSTDPVIGGTQIHLTTAQARLLGLDSYSGSDSTVSLKMSLMNFTRPPLDPDKYDLQQVVEHEVDEVLGISSGLPDTSMVWPVDLFRYTTNLVRTFTTSGDDAYFSIDGTNLIARYNMDSGGDYADWWSYDANWAPPGTPPHPQVQDAFSGPNVAIDLGVPELTALDVVGWTLAVITTPTVRPTIRIVRSGANQITLSWSNNFIGFVLQERANLTSAPWVPSLSGLTNPAVIQTTGAQKYYQLFKPAVPLVTPPKAAAGRSSGTTSLKLTTRALRPRQP